MTRFGSALTLTLLLLLVGCGDDGTSEGPGSGPSVARGGQLYDKYWRVSTAVAPTDTHPLWAQRPDAESNARTGADTWRCKECHGWDYKGVNGAYAKGSHKTGFDGVFGSQLSRAEIVTSMADTHGYRTAGLSDVDLESLAMFVREGLTDTAKWIDESGAFRGDAQRGEALYMKGLGTGKACAACHGVDGLKAPGDVPGYEDFVGKIATKNPWEFLHKVRFGQPGTGMPAAVLGGASMQDIVDLCAFAQTLPKAK